MRISRLLISGALLLACGSVHAALVAGVRQKPVPQVTNFQYGEVCYLYNTKAQGFWCGANDYGTRASVADEGWKVKLDEFTTSGGNKAAILRDSVETGSFKGWRKGWFIPELIKKGHVYVLQTPLFRVRNRRTKIKSHEVIAEADLKQPEKKKSVFITRYCYSDEERLKAISDLGPDPEITRFKGLGEISPDEFKNFIGPDMRLEQVTLHKNDQVQKLLEYYMGKNSMERQNFIIDNLVIEDDRPEELEE